MGVYVMLCEHAKSKLCDILDAVVEAQTIRCWGVVMECRFRAENTVEVRMCKVSAGDHSILCEALELHVHVRTSSRFSWPQTQL